MSELDTALLSLGCLYAATIGWLYAGVVRTQRAAVRSISADAFPGGVPSASVIVAARDEEAVIAECLHALREQRYDGSLEVIVVDDRSSDATAEIVRSAATTWSQLHLVVAASELRFRCPKKSALAQGIEASSGALLLFTDADCTPPPGWVAATVARFTSPEVGVVAGYARSREVGTRRRHRLRRSLLALDNAAIGALSAGSIGMGYPLACTGRNMAYRRQVYEDVGGFEAIGHLVGGDDVYFVRRVAAMTPWKTVYNCSEEAIVECASDSVGIGAVVNQKLRHASKAGHYEGAARLVGIVAYTFHALLLLGASRLLVAAVAGTAVTSLHWPPALALSVGLVSCVFGVKLGVDLALVRRFLQRGVEQSLLRYLPLLEIVYIPYVLLFVPVGRMGWFRWKTGESE